MYGLLGAMTSLQGEGKHSLLPADRGLASGCLGEPPDILAAYGFGLRHANRNLRGHPKLCPCTRFIDPSA